LGEEGAHLVCVDLDEQAGETTADALRGRLGEGVGVAGTGISGCGPAISLGCDITDADSIRQMLDQLTLAYGGLDQLVITAGLFPTPQADGQNTNEQWQKAFDVNAIAPHRVAQQAKRIWDAQQLEGALVVTTSVNGVVPKTGSMAYDTSKAAANHLVRELAVQLAPHVRVNAVAPATVVAGSQMFPRERVIASLSKYGIEHADSEDTEALRQKLAEFYASRTLTHQPIRPEDQAEAVWFLLSNRSQRTTGQIFNVDGGLPEAFLR
jgi:NAD(P)-dependent dehydrogenase (short-subunit alcohol dehydrogenase family)